MLDKLENAKDNAVGKIKETVGQITNDQELELSGKLQSLKADVGNKVDEMKEEVLGKVNGFINYAEVSKKNKS